VYLSAAMNQRLFNDLFITRPSGVRGGAAGCGNALQARRSGVRFPMGSLGFFIDLILPAAL